MRIARQNYEAERRSVPALPPIGSMPNLEPFAANGLGVAALDQQRLVGYLCCVPPFQNAFGSTRATGVFSPMHANGTLPENRARIYACLYQAAGGKWARAGASSHSICLYAHDTAGQQQFFRYGFGLRCVDAIRDMEPIEAPDCPDLRFSELSGQDRAKILPLDKLLAAHLEQSPSFLRYPPISDEARLERIAQSEARYFAASLDDAPIAYIKLSAEGETFICETPGMTNITGACCLPEYRGKGVYQALLSYTVGALRAEGLTRLGVDFESFNPTARGFWLKYFRDYTHSVVRRIDERALEMV